MEPVSFDELVAAIDGQATRLDVPAVTRVSTDSREIRKGDVFWALPGKTHDGHNFVGEALRNGALGCVVEDQRSGSLTGPLIRVPDTLMALAGFARWYRQQRDALVIGVTGSVGKTTTKEMLFAALSCVHAGLRSQKSYNNEVGLPLSLLELQSDHEFGVFELGASRVGDIRSLCEIACPEVGVIPKVGVSHLETFGSRENIYAAKGELLEALPPHGFAVLGGDDEAMRAMAGRAKCPVILVGETEGNHLQATGIDVTPHSLRLVVERKKYELPGAGRQHVLSALCAIAVGREIGMQPGDIAAGLQTYVPPPGRGRAEACGPWTVIDDTYNANPTSMEAALRSLGSWPTAGPRIFIAGEMLELGPESAGLHAQVGRAAARAKVDRLLAIGRHAGAFIQGAIAGGLPRQAAAECPDLEIAYTLLDCWLESGAVVAVKGSRAARMERVVDWLKQKAQETGGISARPRRAVA